MKFREALTKDTQPFSSRAITAKVTRQRWIDNAKSSNTSLKWVQYYQGKLVFMWDDGSYEPYSYVDDDADDWVAIIRD